MPVSPSQALPRQLSQRESQAITFVAKVLGETRKLPAVLLALPLGELSPQVTERAHAVSPVTKVSNATRNFSVIAKSSPFGGSGTPSGVTERVQPVESLQKTFPQRRAFAESGAAAAVSLHDPSREKAILENPQIFQNCEIINILSAEHG